MNANNHLHFVENQNFNLPEDAMSSNSFRFVGVDRSFVVESFGINDE